MALKSKKFLKYSLGLISLLVIVFTGLFWFLFADTTKDWSSFYEGDELFGVPHGLGVFERTVDGERYLYEGNFVLGAISGEGKIIYNGRKSASNRSWTGKFTSGELNGKGTYTQGGDFRYEGNFSNGTIEGLGKVTLLKQSESWYEGTFGEGLFLSGRGQHKYGSYSDSRVYTGKFKNNKAHGQGTIIQDGDRGELKISGMFKEGLLDKTLPYTCLSLIHI